MNNKKAKSQEEIDWENRTLCIDESCIGVVGPDVKNAAKSLKADNRKKYRLNKTCLMSIQNPGMIKKLNHKKIPTGRIVHYALMRAVSA